VEIIMGALECYFLFLFAGALTYVFVKVLPLIARALEDVLKK
jgi:hypothetical protein